MLSLIVGSAALAQQAPVPLPQGGQVKAGDVVIGTPGDGSMTIRQASDKAIIDWDGFSIGAAGNVRFENGAGATLNRVTGRAVSAIDGVLSASGSVYLLNPNGIVVGQHGVIDVGGSFVGSTLTATDADFLRGGDLALTGGATTAVVNYGRIGALGGDVALIAARVDNHGSIDATQGGVALVAGYDVLVRDRSVGGDRFAVRLGGADTSVVNAGTVAAAQAELRANGGNVYALAGNAGGVIRATGVADRDGHVFLTAGNTGTLSVAGVVQSRGPDGSPGSIETSGGVVRIDAAAIDAGQGGRWLLDPADLVIDQAAAATISGSLNAGTSVTQQTSAGAGGNGDIIINPTIAIGWTTNAGLTLTAFRNVTIGAGATITSSGGGAVTLYADNTGTGTGTVSFGANAGISTAGPTTIFYNRAAPVATPTSFAPYVFGGGTLVAYVLVNTSQDLIGIGLYPALNYALGRDIDLAGQSFSPIGGYSDGFSTHEKTFTGTLDGMGHAILNLNEVLSNRHQKYVTPYNNVGLFSSIGPQSSVRNINFVGGNVSLDNTDTGISTSVGVVAGANLGGTISNISSSVAVTGINVVYLGGIVGLNSSGYVTNATSSGAIQSSITLGTPYPKPGYVGGITGWNGGAIANSYTTGNIVAFNTIRAGGIAGQNTGLIDRTYASGLTAADGVSGALVGENLTLSGAPTATVSNGYWDQTTTSQTSGVGISSGTLSNIVAVGGNGPNPYLQSSYSSFTFGPGGNWFQIDGLTRPILRSEYSTTIDNAHQLQLVAMNLGESYTLGNDIDLAETSRASGIWGPGGFVPVGSGEGAAFEGQLIGRAKVLSNLTINATSAGWTGLFGVIGTSGLVGDLTLLGTVAGIGQAGGTPGGVGAVAGLNKGLLQNVSSNASVVASGSYAGGLVGLNSGAIGGSHSYGTVTGTSLVGGLAGANMGGAVTASSASGTVSGSGAFHVGGLLGYNSGTVADAYATGDAVSDTAAFVGGLVGYNDAAGQIARSVASGAVRAGSSDRAGTLVGRNYGALSDSYWDAGIGGPGAVAVGYDAGQVTDVTAISGADRYASASYGALGFTDNDPWFIVDGVTRPMLRSEASAQITNGHQLQAALLGLGGTYRLRNDIDLSAIGRLSEVWNPATGFAPIGSAATPFSGTFNGQGFTIRALKINQPGSDGVGLFGQTAATASIANLVLAAGTVAGRDDIGGAVGYNRGTITNVTSSISGSGVNSVGSIAGYNLGTVTNATVRDAAQIGGTAFLGGVVGYNGGKLVLAKSAAAVSGGTYVGGIAGYNAPSATIDQPTATGTIRGQLYAGGIAGYNGGSLTNATVGAYQQNLAVTADQGAGGLAGYNTGAIYSAAGYVSVSGTGLVGGLAGVNAGSISNVSIYGNVSGMTQVGGLVGVNTATGSVSGLTATGTVRGTNQVGGVAGYNAGTITGDSATASVDGTNGVYVGGIVGYNAGTVINAVARQGSVLGGTWTGGAVGYNDATGTVASSSAAVNVGGVSYTGGLVGYNGGTVTQSSAYSSVYASATGAGGLVGYNAGSVIQGIAGSRVLAPSLSGGLVALNAGAISRSSSSGAVTGTDRVGGLVGANAGSIRVSYSTATVSGAMMAGGLIGYNNGVVSDVYATGAVTGGNAAGSGGLVGYADTASSIMQGYAAGAVSTGGGLFGSNYGASANLRFDTGTTGRAYATQAGSNLTGTAIGGTTGLNPYDPASYGGFDFVGTWAIKPGVSRPYLLFAPQNPPPN